MSQNRIIQSRFPYFVTSNTYDSYPFFDDNRFAEILSQNIFLYSAELEFTLYAYCIMPDHFHILSKTASKFNISTVMKAIKSKTYCDLYQGGLYKGNVWQGRFYDKVIRDTSDLNKVINYIRNNPVSADLEDKYKKAPYMYIA